MDMMREDNKSKEEIMEKLHAVAIKIESTHTEEEICQLAVDAAENVLDFDVVEVLIREKDTLVVKSKSSTLPDIEAQDMGIDEGIAGKTFQDKKAYLVKDVKKDKIASPSSDKYRSGISIPIGTFGVFQAISAEVDGFDQEDLRMGELLVSHVRGALNRIRSEKDLRKSEEKYRTLFERVPVGIYRTAPDGTIIDANPALVKMLKYSDKNSLLSSKAPHLFVNPEDRMRERSLLKEGKIVQDFETQMYRNDGTVIWVQDNARAITDDRGDILFYEGIMKDITEQKKAEEKLKRSLEEKEVLLGEIHHRVKNNMQVVSSILKLQADQEENEDISRGLKKGQNRIRSMAIIHEMLYEAEDVSRVNLSDYIARLVTILYRTYNVNHKKVALKMEMESISLGIDQATPCALVINELLSNTLEHAFPEDYTGRGELRISASLHDTEVSIVVSDNGVGTPEGIDLESSETFGLRLIKMLITRQLYGEIELERDGGTRFTIKFEKERENHVG
jgi:PAS domain S-box-containing protein